MEKTGLLVITGLLFLTFIALSSITLSSWHEGSTPIQQGPTPVQSDITPGKDMSAPGQGGSEPGKAEPTPGRSETKPVQSRLAGCIAQCNCPPGMFCIGGIAGCVGQCNCPTGEFCRDGVQGCIHLAPGGPSMSYDTTCSGPGGTCANGDPCHMNIATGQWVCCPPERACSATNACCPYGQSVQFCGVDTTPRMT